MAVEVAAVRCRHMHSGQLHLGGCGDVDDARLVELLPMVEASSAVCAIRLGVLRGKPQIWVFRIG